MKLSDGEMEVEEKPERKGEKERRRANIRLSC